jgi:hypothetical protein
LLAACTPQKPASSSRLADLTRRLPAMAPCDKIIPQEWSTSWPIPVRDKGQLHYRVFFFGRDGNPTKGFIFHEPEGFARFSLSGDVFECRRIDATSRALPVDGWNPEGTLDQIVERSRRLHAATEEAAGFFDSGRTLTSEEKRRVADFKSLFASLVRPGHAASYRALSPEFWTWVGKNGA